MTDPSDDLFARVYEEMRAQAHHQRRRWHRDYTLNTAALVHEAYLKPWLTSTLDSQSGLSARGKLL